MAINLRKIMGDLQHVDPQIQTFALMSITRLAPQIVESAEEIQSIYDKLQGLIKSENPDVVFLARKASNHIDTVFRPYFQERAAKKHPQTRNPRDMDRESLLQTLDENLDSKYLASIIIRFIEVGTSQDLSVLQRFLSHSDERVRANTVEVFDALGAAANVEALLPLLADRNNRVRGNVITALVGFGHTDVKRNLEEMLCMGMIGMRETAVWVLSRLELPFCEELLIRASADPYDGVRLRAVQSLAVYPTRPSIDLLKRMMNDIDINICEAAVESLKSIKECLLQAKQERESEQPQEVQSQEAREDAAGVELEPLEADPVHLSGVMKLPEPRPTVQASEERLALREFGTEIYQMCRMNVITHEVLDNVFYEILRYQDFLRAYLTKKQRGDTGEVSPTAAIDQLQDKIKSAFVELGERALELTKKHELKIPGDEGERVKPFLLRLQELESRE